MSTKNLARTAIEGGRCTHYKHEVDDARRGERAGKRAFLHLVRLDPEAAEGVDAPKRQPVSPCFDDKLRPIYRWLDSKVGHSWAKVRADLFSRFDDRTTPGRHVLYDHILREVSDATAVDIDNLGAYFVDERGLLQKNPDYRFRRRGFSTVRAPIPYAKAVEFLGNRKIGRCGPHYVWFVPTRYGRSIRAVWGPRNYNGVYAGVVIADNKLRYVNVYHDGVPILKDVVYSHALGRYFGSPRAEESLTNVSYRQAQLLTPEEEKFFLSLPEHAREEILSHAPPALKAHG